MHKIAGARRRHDNLGCEAVQEGPEHALYGALPFAGVSWGEGSCIRAEKKSRAREFGCKISDPKRGTDITGVTKDGVKISLANELPDTRVVQSPKPLGIGPFVGNFDPGVSIQQRNVPLYFCA